MAAVDDPKTLGRTRLGFASEAEIDEFVETLGRFERGEITPDEWRRFRLVRGTYGQRQDDVQMIRVKIPQGILSAGQLLALADVSQLYSRGFGHITTRQNVQFHFVRLHEVEAAMRRLAEAGLTTREACGSAVRNITGCPYAGVAKGEPFDVTPYAEALTRFLLRHPLSAALPRKFKIAFEGCPEDHALTAINDLGFRARVRRDDGRRTHGFRVTVAGGTSILPRSGAALFDFLPAGEILDVAEAVLRVYQRHGDFQHKQRNRLKFLIRDLGWEVWHGYFEEELARIRAEGGNRLPFDPDRPPVEGPVDPSGVRPPSVAETAARVASDQLRGPGLLPVVQPIDPDAYGGLLRWRQTNVNPQKHAGYSVVTATLVLGDVTGQQMRVLADLALAYGDGTVRVTTEQNVLFRWVSQGDVPALYLRLAAAGLALPGARTIADVTSCPGAESCRLAVTQSRGLGRTLGEFLRSRPDLIARAPDLQLKISGCPNGCGQHHIAGIGFQGSVRRLGDRVIPQYFVMLGGGVEDGGASFGRLAAKIPARRLTDALERLLEFYCREREEGEPAAQFFRRIELERAKATVADLERLTPADADAADYVDLGEEKEYRAEVMDGECSA